MHPTQSLYPASPVNVPLSVTSPSASFKKEVQKVLLSISLFFAVYLILIAFSIALAAGCIYAGFFVIINSGHIIGIIAGVGIMSIGIMVFIFLIKFIFSVKKFDEAGSIAVTANEQPELFNFIKKLTADTQTQFPKKIVLSPEVNACVFYNDSFWSMIFPVKKNLQIGLGLVNSLTLSEFKAVMAHEFGHFSQRSMKLGSFVYNVNKAIYNMLYENKDYGDFLQKWGSLHWAISIFVWTTVQIVKLIQKILQGMYGFINKNYMSLSREMEFHADAVAASVSGSNNLVTALRKLEISEVCYQTVLQKANEFIKENTKLENVYSNHDAVMKKYALHNNLPVENATPVTDEAFFKKFQYHKINIKNQWASHPPREERNYHLQQANVDAERDTRPAWIIFNKPEQLQHDLTALLYKTVPADILQQHMNAAAFTERYEQEIKMYSLPEAYNGFYDDRQLGNMDVDNICQPNNTISIDEPTFKSLFNDTPLSLIKSLAGNEYDANFLKAITEKQVDVKSFDYDGEKKELSAAPELLEKLTQEIALQKTRLQQHEESIVAFFYNAALKINDAAAVKLKEKYIALLAEIKNTTLFINICQHITNQMAPLMAGQAMSLEQAAVLADDIKAEAYTMKPLLRLWNAQGLFDTDELLKSKVKNFVDADYRYFVKSSFLDNELNTLHQVINETPVLLTIAQSKSFKDILQLQLDLYEQAIKL
jgi:Zn-dependent protease with chaperone function